MVKLGACYWRLASQAYDAVVIGAGHNGLVAAAYLQKEGFKVCVLEKRNLVGGAAVTEEIVPGFKFSRASYVLSLLRPKIYQELKLQDFGLHILRRDPSSYTPIHENFWKDQVRSLTLGTDRKKNIEEISKLSKADAVAFGNYEEQLGRIARFISPLLDVAPSHFVQLLSASRPRQLWNLLADRDVRSSVFRLAGLGYDCLALYELLTSAPLDILERWFENEVLIATLAMDALIGTTESPYSPGTGYVLLLHSILGDSGGGPGRWGIPVGGMGSVSQAIAGSARALGVDICTEQDVTEILLDSNNVARGVRTSDGVEIHARVVLSNATPQVTFMDLLKPGSLPRKFETAIRQIDYSSGVTKINVAVDKLPNFLADPTKAGQLGPHHQTTIHINSEKITALAHAHADYVQGSFSARPIIEMTIPSSLDSTIAPKGSHVVLLFTQYTPYSINGQKWRDEDKEAYASTVFSLIDEYAPGFSQSIIGKEVLTPPDIENIFGLTGGNIFHGSMAPDKLFLLRPATASSDWLPAPYTPIPNLFLCGSGSHPGGGVSGAPGRCCATQVIPYLMLKQNS